MAAFVVQDEVASYADEEGHGGGVEGAHDGAAVEVVASVADSGYRHNADEVVDGAACRDLAPLDVASVDAAAAGRHVELADSNRVEVLREVASVEQDVVASCVAEDACVDVEVGAVAFVAGNANKHNEDGVVDDVACKDLAPLDADEVAVADHHAEPVDNSRFAAIHVVAFVGPGEVASYAVAGVNEGAEDLAEVVHVLEAVASVAEDNESMHNVDLVVDGVAY